MGLFGRVDVDLGLYRLVAQSLCDRLQGIRKPSSPLILDLASGPGGAFPVFYPVFNNGHWILVDLVERFLREARSLYRPSFIKSYFKNYRLDCINADVKKLPLASRSVDVMIANLVLPCIVDRRAVFREWRRVLKPDGVFLFSLLGPDTFREIRWVFSFADSHAHTELFPDMHDIADELVQAGFQDVVVDVDIRQTIYSDFISLCKDLKKIGVFHVTTNGKRQGLLSRAAWKIAVDKYETIRHDKGLPLTWELIFGHAWGGGEKAPPSRSGEDYGVVRFFRNKKDASPV
ncbi:MULTISPECIES: methyltransferase domain-containing protein [Candidatus Ichthyocystis]|uniref:Putative Malonyl-CoA O-methyltransferase BioC n=1 Tax=Candidatus Ichthyocystis hellenicum TaxID=1561003 RepID=A0A0S4M118_9BURK|nr:MULTISPECIES: methyltransferase domain-containing protein [Ichthyocystis]CUT17477.1 putative Malonyl-CoA O-methyltransferase BioC [Candidatus Ichthyocystis hellenicum]